MRSWLYVPGNSPTKIVQAGIYGADGLVFDLEDAVPGDRKREARHLLAEALREIDFGGVFTAVRINGGDKELWRQDLGVVLKAGIRRIRLPKVEGVGALYEVLGEIDRLEGVLGIPAGDIRVQCILETPLGVESAFAVAGASPRIESLSFGAEDYCTALGISRKGPPFALDYPRSRIASAAAAFGVAALDTVWAAYRDSDGLEADALRSRQLGFSGKSVIHPDQIEPVNRIFSPSGEEVEWARTILTGSGEEEAAGARTVNGSMVDLPVVRRAERILLDFERYSGIDDKGALE